MRSRSIDFHIHTVSGDMQRFFMVDSNNPEKPVPYVVNMLAEDNESAYLAPKALVAEITQRFQKKWVDKGIGCAIVEYHVEPENTQDPTLYL